MNGFENVQKNFELKSEMKRDSAALFYDGVMWFLWSFYDDADRLEFLQVILRKSCNNRCKK